MTISLVTLIKLPSKIEPVKANLAKASVSLIDTFYTVAHKIRYGWETSYAINACLTDKKRHVLLNLSGSQIMLSESRQVVGYDP